MRIGVVDYRLNNLRSVQKAFELVGADVFVSDNPAKLQEADKLVLPGVGAFGAAMKNLTEMALDRTIRSHVEAGKPLLGICLGMQLLCDKSFENGEHQGLGIVHGTVRLFPDSQKVPHIGWNQIEMKKESPLFFDVHEGCYVYFVHSYFVDTADEVTLARTEYGFPFVSIFGNKNVYGMQFHPEKSQTSGLQMLKNFVERT
jgi:imidazole glycerol-phosphate synthase subunit HisH